MQLLASEALHLRNLPKFPPRRDQWLASPAPPPPVLLLRPQKQRGNLPLPQNHLQTKLSLSGVIFFTQNVVTCVLDKAKPLLLHLNPDDALSPQLRVNRGELSPNCVIVDHLLDSLTKSSIRLISILQDIIGCKFTIVAFCRAASAKLQDFD